MGNADLFSFLVKALKGFKIGSIKRAKKALIGCMGFKTHDNRELIIMAQDKILINHTMLSTT